MDNQQDQIEMPLSPRQGSPSGLGTGRGTPTGGGCVLGAARPADWPCATSCVLTTTEVLVPNRCHGAGGLASKRC